jgi:pyrimidine-nucleoside phosphorylase
MKAYEIIRKKRDGEPLDKEEINSLITVVAEGAIPDYQVSAFLMAVFQNGMTNKETPRWA